MEYNKNQQSPRPRIGQTQGGYSQSRYGDTPKETAESIFAKLAFKAEWITTESTRETVEYAEKAGEYMANNGLTNSKIRSIYGEIKRIEMSEFEKEKSSFYLLKPKVAYAVGRDDKNQGLKLFQKIFNESWRYVSNDKTYKNFCNFIEAILAFHKAYGGKD